jgi:putative membrane protein
MVNDYITVMLANMVAALVLAAGLLVFGLSRPHAQAWAPALGAVGLVAFAIGLHMTLTWPITLKGFQWANIAFGETTLLLGAVYLAASVSLAMRWNLLPVGVLACVAGLVALVVGIYMARLGLSKAPTLTAIGFVTAGIGAILVLPAIAWRHVLALRLASAAAMLISAAIWAMTAVVAYGGHLESMSRK